MLEAGRLRVFGVKFEHCVAVGVCENEREVNPWFDIMSGEFIEGCKDKFVLSCDLGPDFVEEGAEADRWSDGVPGADEASLADEDGELGEVGNMDPLHRLVEDVGDQNLVELVEAGDPVRESAGVIVGAENDAGADDAEGIGEGFVEDFFAADFERAVGCGGHLTSFFAVGDFGLLG